MRFISGIIVGVIVTIGAALLHDDNLPARARSVADEPIVNWDALGKVAANQTAAAQNWWNGLMGRNGNPQQP